MTAIRKATSFAGALVLAIGLALAIGACSSNTSNSTSTTSTTTAPTITSGPTTTLFEGTLTPGGFAFYSFTVTGTGDADVMLASVTTLDAPGHESNVILGLAIGQPLGEDCSIISSLPARAALQSPLVNTLQAGTYCVRVYDMGYLTSSVNFAIRIVHT